VSGPDDLVRTLEGPDLQVLGLVSARGHSAQRDVGREHGFSFGAGLDERHDRLGDEVTAAGSREVVPTADHLVGAN
jgi:hypothetical protein